MEARRHGGLGIIFSFFLGLMVTAFIGVGVYTFYPPVRGFDPQVHELSRQEQAIRAGRPYAELTDDEREEIETLADERQQLLDAAERTRQQWSRITSIVLITLATLTMAVALARAQSLPVISNGLLLGGLFTMLYGVGWIVTTDTSVGRFVVITVALLITLALGYIRFVRERAASRPQAGSGPPASNAEDIADIERRLRSLEERIHGAASALGQGTAGRER